MAMFCGFMNLSPMQTKWFDERHNKLCESYKQIEDISIQNTVNQFSFSEAEGLIGISLPQL